MGTAKITVRILLSLFLVSVGGGESWTVRGYPGGGVLIRCRYERRYTSNPKYFCTGSWPNCDDQIRTGVKNEWRSTGRFSLLDNTSSTEFWVMIRDLTVQDSGLYQCAVDKDLAFDVYTPVDLTVEEDLSYEESISVNGHVGGGVNISCKYPQSLSRDPKFLCRRVGTVDCKYTTSVKESRKWRNVGNLNLHDDRAKKTFTVSINSLTEGESGEYWCGAESDWTSDDGYKVYITQVHLSVTEPPASTSSTLPSSTTLQTPKSTASTASTAATTAVISSFTTSAGVRPQSSTHGRTLSTQTTTSSAPKTTPSSEPAKVSFVMPVVSVILVLLLIGLLFFILTLRRRSKSPGPSNKTQVSSTLYEEVKDTRHRSTSDAGVTTVYSMAQPPSQTVYGNVQIPSNSSDFSNPVYSAVTLPSNPPDQDTYSTTQLPTIPSDSSINAPERSAGDPANGPEYTTVKFSKTERSSSVACSRENDSCDYTTVNC